MSVFKLLIVEDNDQDLETCRATVDRYKDQKQRDVELVECRSVEDAFEKLDNYFDGAIIDLRLDDQGDEGNMVLKKIEESYYRIPVAILTGTPDATDPDVTHIGVFKKGDPGAGYDDLLDKFWEIHNTGMTRIMGGKGVIEETLKAVFLKNLIPQRNKWIEYGVESPLRTERALLRYTLNHLIQLLEDDMEKSFPEEVYLYPPLNDKILTGSILKQKDSEKWFAVMNPACDLVPTNCGGFRTERVLLVEIESAEKVIGVATRRCDNRDDKKDKLYRVLNNNYTLFYHWLPGTTFFKGGFLNFRKLSSYKKRDIERNYDSPFAQISPSFVKDIAARFSIYYARQGQPDIECSEIIDQLISE